MKSLSFPRIAPFVVALLLIGMCTAQADPVEIAEESGFFGCYLNNEKVGHAKWELTRAGEGAKTTYKIVWTEERTIKDRKENYTHTAVLGTDLSMKSVEIEVKKPGNTMTMTGKAAKDGFLLKAAMGKNALPDRTVKVKPGCSWSAIAPLVWAWRNQPAEAAKDYIRLNEFGYTELTDSLTPEAKTRKFQKEDTDLIEWCAEDRKVVIVCSTDGRLLEYTEKSKTATTMLIREPEKVALSGKRFEEFDEPIAAEGEKKPGKNKPMDTGPVEGDDEGLFAERLAVVGDDAEEGCFDEYIKIPEKFSIRAAEGWTCSEVESTIPIETLKSWKIQSDKNKHLRVVVGFAKYKEGHADPNDENADPDDLIEMFDGLVLMTAVADLGVNCVSMSGDHTRFKFPDGTIMFGQEVELSGDNAKYSYKAFRAYFAGENGLALSWGLAPEDEWDDNSDTIFSMLGSLRAE